jgi:Leucine-rich repeat (LRR) protein
MIEFLDFPCEMKNLQELNMRKNKITVVNKIGTPNLQKLNLGFNQIKSISNLENTLPCLRDLTLE